MIEIREKQTSESETIYELFIDNLPVNKVFIRSEYENNNVKYEISTQDYETSLKLISHTLSEFPSLSSLGFRYKIEWLEVASFFSIDYDSDKQAFAARCIIMKLSNWRRPYSFQDYFRVLLTSYEASGGEDIQLSMFGDYDESPVSGSAISFECSFELPIDSQLTRVVNTLRPFHEEADKVLTSSSDANSITVSFDFPLEIRTACEQYLLYFVQFLRDLGVEANTSLTHEAGQVLFTVTPEDKNEALDKIRAALDVYLHLPSNPVSDTTNEAIAVQRLEANILRLRSDLKLAAAELQAKNATIEAKQLTIDIQKGLLSGDIIFNSMKDVTPKPEDKEELLGGIVALATYKDKGVEVNLAELYRKLKALFKDKE